MAAFAREGNHVLAFAVAISPSYQWRSPKNVSANDLMWLFFQKHGRK
jgi:hypothetical protein